MFIITFSSLAVIPSNSSALKITFALLGKFAVTSSSHVIGIHSPEVFPTVLRHKGIGSCSVVGRIGSVAAPFMKNLVSNQFFKFWKKILISNYFSKGCEHEPGSCYDILCNSNSHWCNFGAIFTRN
jgi:hypothetical protein